MSAQPTAPLALVPESAPVTAAKTPGVAERTLAEVIKALSRPLPSSMLVSKPRKDNGKTIWLDAIEWHTAVRVLDKYAPGWSNEVRAVTPAGNQLVVTVRITVPCADGVFFREATGIEDLNVNGYGDTASNAEAMALKRAASKFGLGLYLYRNKTQRPDR